MVSHDHDLRLRILPRRRRGGVADHLPHVRRGVYLLPSLLTMGNLLCGYACIVLAMRGDFAVAAVFIGIAIVLDMLDGRVARLTGTTSAFGIEFDSLADVVSFGLAPAILAYAWGLQPLGRLGWAAGFVFLAGAAVRLARFNIQQATQDKRYFVGMPSPAAAGVPASTVFAYPAGFHTFPEAIPVLALVLVPALLMVSAFRFHSFKTFDLRVRRRYPVLILVAAGFALLVAQPDLVLVALAYGYLLSPALTAAVQRLRRRPPAAEADGGDEESGSPVEPQAVTRPPAG
ncbi:MAG: CDP-diacylglycerol--serine O-phosphatidyltransferase [Acidimicrobiia bacterium]|nr:CDP-diacylglycerol--serine O-phosphatidyltransferase [Acidimicrobiia bacterium]